jgi:Ala-tRNA(Pro) deacylase
MAVAMTLRDYLADNHIDYDLVTHEPTASATRSAQASHVPGSRLAKAVILKHEHGYVMAVLSANDQVHVGRLGQSLGRTVDLASEAEVSELFGDCALGAVPAVGEAYGLEMVVEESLDFEPEIYFEAGDHKSLVHLSSQAYHRLTVDARRISFGMHA